MGNYVHDFEKAEYEIRYKRARELMIKNELDALLIGDKKNCRYFTGQFQKHINRTTFVILPRDKAPTILCPEMYAESARKLSWVRDIKPYPLPFTRKYLIEVLEDLKLNNAKIGVETDDLFFCGFRLPIPYDEFMKFKKDLPKAQFIGASEAIWKMRMVKTQAEIDCIRKACKITNNVYQTAFKELRIGMTKEDIMRLFLTNMIKEGADCPFFNRPGPQAFISLDIFAYDKKIGSYSYKEKLQKEGDILHVDMGVIYKGYCTDFSSQAVIGVPTKEMKRDREKVVQNIQNSIDVVRPGNKLSEIHAHWHGTGLAYVEPPFRGLYNQGIHGDLEIEKGMVLCIEDRGGLYYGRYKQPTDNRAANPFHVEDIVAITDDGCENLSRSNKELYSVL
jgi:Xaa-Pro aminopeptidase